jgi:hypothetical protein
VTADQVEQMLEGRLIHYAFFATTGSSGSTKRRFSPTEWSSVIRDPQAGIHPFQTIKLNKEPLRPIPKSTWLILARYLVWFSNRRKREYNFQPGVRGPRVDFGARQ